MPSSDDINSAFGDQWGLSLLLYVSGTCLDLVRYKFGTRLVSILYRFGTRLVSVRYRFGTHLVSVLYKFGLDFWTSEVSEWTRFGTCPHRVPYWIQIVCQVGGTPQMYLRSFEVEGKP